MQLTMCQDLTSNGSSTSWLLLTASSSQITAAHSRASAGTEAEGDLASQLYNDSARVLTLQIMLHSLSDTTLAAQPVVQQHYRNHAARIIESCAQAADQSSSSAGYRASMKRLLPELKSAFDRLH